MIIDFLINLMNIDSTSGNEKKLGEHIANNVLPEGAELEVQRIPNGHINLFYKWGKPEIIFCSHYDTVPPYIPPLLTETKVTGRGSCDAKGQIACLLHTCRELHSDGHSNFGLLLLAGEEVGSYGAKAANDIIKGCNYVIIGEPTENKLIRAAKGNILFEVCCSGRSCHSGYPENGKDAVQRCAAFLNDLFALNLPEDKILGKTTFNVGALQSENAHNVISEKVTFKIFARTTFETHSIVENKIKEIAGEDTEVKISYGDNPLNFHTLDGFETATVAFGSDAPDLNNLGKPLMLGPGSILNAHTTNEFILIEDLYKAVDLYKKIFNRLRNAQN